MSGSSVDTQFDFRRYTNVRLIEACKHLRIGISWEAKRTRGRLLSALDSLSSDDVSSLHAELLKGSVRFNPGRKRQFDDVENQAASDDIESPSDRHTFFEVVPDDVIEDCVARFIDRTNNQNLETVICISCAARMRRVDAEYMDLDDIPNGTNLQPAKFHRRHELTRGMLLHVNALVDHAHGFICSHCLQSLRHNSTPPLSLANNMWIGDVPFDLKVLTFAERLLIARYFPCAYIIKLFPKDTQCRSFKPSQLHSGLKGNVSTYPLDTSAVAKWIDSHDMPPSIGILSSVVGITFVGPNNLPERTLPSMFNVRRDRVKTALRFLLAENPIYKNIVISDSRLAELPVNSVPEEFFDITRYSNDVNSLDKEQAGYVPHQDVAYDDIILTSEAVNAQNKSSNLPSVEMERVNYNAVIDVEDDQSAMNIDIVEPDVIPLHSYGVVDVSGSTITDNDIQCHALANTASEDFASCYIRRGSVFVNEYGRKDPETGLRSDGGPSNPSHLLGSFPVLFPYGKGGFEVNRLLDVPYEVHARWCLNYADGRFRKDLHFIFLVFGVTQKRSICRAAVLQTKRSNFVKDMIPLSLLKPSDLHFASTEEARRLPFSNPSVQALCNHVTSVRSAVVGTDESRRNIRSLIWSTVAIHGPPSLWITLNPADIHDPIAQFLVGEEINLDKFNALLGPNSEQRAMNIAEDPFAAAEFFRVVILATLEELLGLRSIGRGRHVSRRPGIFGLVQAYIGTVEAQGCGTLHLHMLLWLCGAFTSKQMHEALQSEIFRSKIRSFINQNIRADINGDDISHLPKKACVSYSRPVDPRQPEYLSQKIAEEKVLARALQFHVCSVTSCLVLKNGQYICKRRAPFPLSSVDWILPSGAWGPRRLCANLNNWNVTLLMCLRCNHDIKLITNGSETKNVTFYISTYAVKKQIKSSNTSALLANRFAFHTLQEKNASDRTESNKRLITRCANALSREQELSAPEVVNYVMGFGDRYISHHYVPIYLNSIVGCLKKKYPVLRQRPQYSFQSVHTEDNTGKNNEDTDDIVRIEVMDGQLQIRDQLKQYMDRGERLDSMSFLDFYLETYDGKLSNNNEDNTAHHSYLVDNRVPYLTSSLRSSRCRIIRRPGHETLPNFIGNWFPRNDRASDKELYCSLMLTLFKPWRVLGEFLDDSFPTFNAAFDSFMATAPSSVLNIVDNIQYFHECSDGAKESSRSFNENGAVIDVNDHPIHATNNADDDIHSTQHIVSEWDVEVAIAGMQNTKLFAFGEDAINVAYDCGIFPSNRPHTAMLPHCQRATQIDMPKFMAWETQLKTLPISVQPKPLVDSFFALNSISILPAVFSSSADHDDQFLPSTRSSLSLLNNEQRHAHNVVENHLLAHLNGNNPGQLLMMVLGKGGVGKSVVINAISDTFEEHSAFHLLAKTATSGVSATLIQGQTVHRWAGLGIRLPKDGGSVITNVKETQERRKRNMVNKQYLISDELSMYTKNLFTTISEIASTVRLAAGVPNARLPFGGINVILFGDFHQFPPVGNSSSALYHSSSPTARDKLGHDLYRQFTTVVILRQQMRIVDPVWANILDRLREGACVEQDLVEIRKLIVTKPFHSNLNTTSFPFDQSVLITSRHSVRQRWNSAAIAMHCVHSGHRLYISPAEDGEGKTRIPLGPNFRASIVTMSTKATGGLEDHIEIGIGMRAMVVLNLATEKEVANGTRGTIVDIVLDSREPDLTPDENGSYHLIFPPPMVIFKPDGSILEKFEGLPHGLIPVSPSIMSFSVEGLNSKKITVYRRQLAITPAYAFTDFKGQGQTIENVVIDLANPPGGRLSPFNAYVALSRGRGRETIRFLRNFDDYLFTTHPCEELRKEDIRLEQLAYETANKI